MRGTVRLTTSSLPSAATEPKQRDGDAERAWGRETFQFLIPHIMYITEDRGLCWITLLDFDCLACSNKRFNKKLIVSGGIEFAIPQVV